MKNMTLALAIALGFCATEAEAQERALQGRKEAVERAEFEKEREEQRLQLMQIQEELRKAREAEKSKEEK